MMISITHKLLELDPSGTWKVLALDPSARSTPRIFSSVFCNKAIPKSISAYDYVNHTRRKILQQSVGLDYVLQIP